MTHEGQSWKGGCLRCRGDDCDASEDWGIGTEER